MMRFRALGPPMKPQKLRLAGSVARPEQFRDDAFEAHLAGVPGYALAIVREVLVQAQPRKACTQQTCERRLARLDRLPPPDPWAPRAIASGSAPRAALRHFAADDPTHRRIVAQHSASFHILVSGKATQY